MIQNHNPQDRLEIYLRFLGITKTPLPDYETLKEISERHAFLINYQNSAIFRTKKILQCSNDDIFERLIVQKLGGMCFEITELLAYFLEMIGFSVNRVPTCTTAPYEEGVLKTHVFLIVPIGQATYLVDVGLGYNQIRTPLQFTLGKTEETVTKANERYQLFSGDSYYEIRMFIKDQWMTCHRFNKQTNKDFPITITREQSIGYYESLTSSDQIVPIRDQHLKFCKLKEDGRIQYLYDYDTKQFTKTVFKMGVRKSRTFFPDYKEFTADVKRKINISPPEELFLNE